MIAALIVLSIGKAITRQGFQTPSIHITLIVVALLSWIVVGWTQGDKTSSVKWAEPLNWPLELRILETLPGVDEGACFDFIEPGFYSSGGNRFEDPVEDEVTPEEARKQNADVADCHARARHDGRADTPQWANWLAALLAATIAIASYDYWRRLA